MTEKRSPSRVVVRSRQRIAPESDNMYRKERRRKDLQVRTKSLEPDGKAPSTPSTLASTPSPKLRTKTDLRSPGMKMTPRVASAEEPIPDLITQTDANGNATTPRSSTAISEARKIHPSGPKPHLHVDKDGKLSEEDACTETLFDSIRMMCCCFLGETQEEEAIEKAPVSKVVLGSQRPRLLPCIHPDDHGKKCLVLDLDETLVHSSFRPVSNADFVIPVQIEDVVHFVYVIKRPGVDEFLTEMAKHYEIVIYTASLNKYADPLLDLLDPNKVIRTRLFRESCVYYEGNYVKDLSLLDRDLSKTIIIDNSPNSYIFHPENAIDCSSFIDDPRDRELNQIGAFLKGVSDVKDVRNICHQWRDWPSVNLKGQ